MRFFIVFISSFVLFFSEISHIYAQVPDETTATEEERAPTEEDCKKQADHKSRNSCWFGACNDYSLNKNIPSSARESMVAQCHARRCNSMSSGKKRQECRDGYANEQAADIMKEDQDTEKMLGILGIVVGAGAFIFGMINLLLDLARTIFNHAFGSNNKCSALSSTLAMAGGLVSALGEIAAFIQLLIESKQLIDKYKRGSFMLGMFKAGKPKDGMSGHDLDNSSLNKQEEAFEYLADQNKVQETNSIIRVSVSWTSSALLWASVAAGVVEGYALASGTGQQYICGENWKMSSLGSLKGMNRLKGNKNQVEQEVNTVDSSDNNETSMNLNAAETDKNNFRNVNRTRQRRSNIEQESPRARWLQDSKVSSELDTVMLNLGNDARPKVVDSTADKVFIQYQREGKTKLKVISRVKKSGVSSLGSEVDISLSQGKNRPALKSKKNVVIHNDVDESLVLPEASKKTLSFMDEVEISKLKKIREGNKKDFEGKRVVDVERVGNSENGYKDTAVTMISKDSEGNTFQERIIFDNEEKMTSSRKKIDPASYETLKKSTEYSTERSIPSEGRLKKEMGKRNYAKLEGDVDTLGDIYQLKENLGADGVTIESVNDHSVDVLYEVKKTTPEGVERREIKSYKIVKTDDDNLVAVPRRSTESGGADIYDQRVRLDLIDSSLTQDLKPLGGRRYQLNEDAKQGAISALGKRQLTHDSKISILGHGDPGGVAIRADFDIGSGGSALSATDFADALATSNPNLKNSSANGKKIKITLHSCDGAVSDGKAKSLALRYEKALRKVGIDAEVVGRTDIVTLKKNSAVERFVGGKYKAEGAKISVATDQFGNQMEVPVQYRKEVLFEQGQRLNTIESSNLRVNIQEGNGGNSRQTRNLSVVEVSGDPLSNPTLKLKIHDNADSGISVGTGSERKLTSSDVADFDSVMKSVYGESEYSAIKSSFGDGEGSQNLVVKDRIPVGEKSLRKKGYGIVEENNNFSIMKSDNDPNHIVIFDKKKKRYFRGEVTKIEEISSLPDINQNSRQDSSVDLGAQKKKSPSFIEGDFDSVDLGGRNKNDQNQGVDSDISTLKEERNKIQQEIEVLRSEGGSIDELNSKAKSLKEIDEKIKLKVNSEDNISDVDGPVQNTDYSSSLGEQEEIMLGRNIPPNDRLSAQKRAQSLQEKSKKIPTNKTRKKMMEGIGEESVATQKETLQKLSVIDDDFQFQGMRQDGESTEINLIDMKQVSERDGYIIAASDDGAEIHLNKTTGMIFDAEGAPLFQQTVYRDKKAYAMVEGQPGVYVDSKNKIRYLNPEDGLFYTNFDGTTYKNNRMTRIKGFLGKKVVPVNPVPATRVAISQGRMMLVYNGVNSDIDKKNKGNKNKIKSKNRSRFIPIESYQTIPQTPPLEGETLITTSLDGKDDLADFMCGKSYSMKEIDPPNLEGMATHFLSRDDSVYHFIYEKKSDVILCKPKYMKRIKRVDNSANEVLFYEISIKPEDLSLTSIINSFKFIDPIEDLKRLKKTIFNFMIPSAKAVDLGLAISAATTAIEGVMMVAGAVTTFSPNSVISDLLMGVGMAMSLITILMIIYGVIAQIKGLGVNVDGNVIKGTFPYMRVAFGAIGAMFNSIMAGIATWQMVILLKRGKKLRKLVKKYKKKSKGDPGYQIKDKEPLVPVSMGEEIINLFKMFEHMINPFPQKAIAANRMSLNSTIHSVSEFKPCLSNKGEIDVTCDCQKKKSCLKFTKNQIYEPMKKIPSFNKLMNITHLITHGKFNYEEFNPLEMKKIALNMRSSAEKLRRTVNSKLKADGKEDKMIKSFDAILKQNAKKYFDLVVTEEAKEKFKNYREGYSVNGLVNAYGMRLEYDKTGKLAEGTYEYSAQKKDDLLTELNGGEGIKEKKSSTEFPKNNDSYNVTAVLNKNEEVMIDYYNRLKKESDEVKNADYALEEEIDINGASGSIWQMISKKYQKIHTEKRLLLNLTSLK